MSDRVYIWQQPDWPRWRYDAAHVSGALAQAHHAQGHLLGRTGDLGFEVQGRARLDALTEEVLKTSAIEGETLRVEAVRSSVARRLGVDIGALGPADRHVDGVVDMVLDATARHDQPLTAERLCAWHAALFPTGYSGLRKIRAGAWRDDASGPMQVVSGALGREEVVHYQAPPAAGLEADLAAFLAWFNSDEPGDPLIKAGLAHLWLVTLHPFDDGNGRIARAVGDMALARAERSSQRLYSLSAQVQRERADYYAVLERTQAGSLDVTDWLAWYLRCLLRALQGAELTFDAVLHKARFWQRWAGTTFNARQVKLLNRLLDGFDGKLTSSRWAALARCSHDTALRDISALLERGVLVRAAAGGRSTHYLLGDAPSGLDRGMEQFQPEPGGTDRER